MRTLRKYGTAPFTVAVIHGGPGAGGEMAPVARVLASCRGVLEPIQTAASVDGQIDELRIVLEENGDLPLVLVGFSWGAWLGFKFAADFPGFVKKLILIGSGPFEERYAENIIETRISRLGVEERAEVESLTVILNNPTAEDKNAALARLGELLSKADAYDPIEYERDAIECRADIYRRVWQEGAELRRSGRLLELAGRIKCPVVAIHGDYDPHPAAGIRNPLSANLKNFRFVLLEKCGHRPWIERSARDEFFRVLEGELP